MWTDLCFELWITAIQVTSQTAQKAINLTTPDEALDPRQIRQLCTQLEHTALYILDHVLLK